MPRTPDAILHPWLEAELSAIVAALPQRGVVVEFAANRALSGQHPEDPEQIMARLEAVGRSRNRAPAPFERGGQCAARRQRAWERRHRLGGSGAVMGLPPSSQPDG